MIGQEKGRVSMGNKRAPSILVLSVLILSLAGCGNGSSSAGGGSVTPTVTGVAPTVVSSSSLPRTITVNGTGFQSGLTVQLTGTSGSTTPSPSQVTATSFQITSIFATGSYTVTVTNPGGPSSSPFNFSAKVATGINFAQRVDYSTGGTSAGPGAGSGSIVMADFNGDGKLDIGVSNYASNTISVFLNKGDGSFGAPIMTTVDPGSASGLGPIVAGDFNEDGKIDLVVATIAGGQSDIVLLGKGDGTFTQGSAIPNSIGFLQAKAVDLNGDKHLDVVASNGTSITVALGKGDGTFSSIVNYSPGPFPNAYYGLDLGDLTGNGKLDIVSADPFFNPGEIFVLKGNGDGTFGTASSQPTPNLGPFSSQPDSVALSDFSNNGKLDLLVGYTSGSAAVAPGNGDGTFALSSQVPIYTSNFGGTGQGIIVRVADLDQDGKPDALVLDYLTGVFAVVLDDSGTISAGSKYSYTIAPGVSDLAVGDLNRDGMPDVVVVNNMTNQISVFLSQSQ